MCRGQVDEGSATKDRHHLEKVSLREALPMTLFHLNAQPSHPEDPSSKTWLVVAASVSEAMTLLPPGQVVVSVEVRSPSRSGPPRLLGWMGPPPLPVAVKR